MKIALLALFVSASVAVAAKYPVSISTTNGRGFGTTTISSLVGKINSGNVTNAAGVRVAYLDDVVSGSATNVLQVTASPSIGVITNGLDRTPFLDPSQTNQWQADAASAALIATNKLDTDLRAYTLGATNKLNTDLQARILGATNKLDTDIRGSLGTAAYSNSVSFQNASATLSNVVSQSSNRYVGSFVGLITTGNVTNASGSRVAYLSDTNGLGGGGGGTYTNNSTGIPGTVTGLGISTNDINLPKLNASSNHFTGDIGASLIGVDSGTATTLSVGTISGIYANQYGYWNSTSNLVGTNAIALANFISPTNSAAVGQVLHATSTAGDTKWDYVNQVLTNSNPVVPDFTLPVNYFVTNAAFLFLAPTGVETTGKKLQVTDVIVTNSTAAAVAVTFPGSIRVTGTAFITNLSVFHFRQFAGKWTNCACEPVW